MYNIALAFDHNHFFYSTNLIFNIFSISPMSNFMFHLFVPESFKNFDYTKVFSKLNTNYKFYYISDDTLKGMRVNKKKYPRISSVTFYRLFMPYLIDSNVENFLYLDNDIYINQSLDSLFKINLLEYAIGAVPIYRMRESKNLDFNAGVLLINVKRYRSELKLENIFSYYSKTLLDDQSILNHFFSGKYLALDLKFNYPISYFATGTKTNKQKKKIYSKAHILHFLGNEKPWDFHSTLPFSKAYKRLFLELHERKPWDRVRIKDVYSKFYRFMIRDNNLIRIVKNKLLSK